jgi:hypothetical protein
MREKGLIPDDETWAWLLSFWNTRDLVTPETQCPTPLTYKDGSTGRCVLDKHHLDHDDVPVNVPHADKDGRLAPKLVSRETMFEVRAMSERLHGEPGKEEPMPKYFALYLNHYGVRQWAGPFDDNTAAGEAVPEDCRASLIVTTMAAYTPAELREAIRILG